jgi:tetratricopeptide (TPR) repeat protein
MKADAPPVQGAQVLAAASTAADYAILDEAIDLSRCALAALAPDHPERSSCLLHLAGALATRFDRAGCANDLDEVLALLQELAAQERTAHPAQLEYPTKLGRVLWTRFTRTGSSADLDRVIELLDESAKTTSADDPGRPEQATILARALGARFERAGHVADLNRAATLLEEALAVSPTHDPDRPARLSMLALAIRSQFDITGNPAELDRAIAVLDDALRTTPANDPERPARLSMLASAVRSRFELAVDPIDLEVALGLLGEAVDTAPADDPRRPRYLADLDMTTREVDLVIEFLAEQLAANAADDSDRARKLTNLAAALSIRFERTNHISDVDRAIELFGDALAATTINNSERPTRLSNLGDALQHRFDVSRDPADLQRATQVLEEAINATAVDHPGRAALLSNTASVRLGVSRRTGRADELDRAIELFESALAITSKDHPDRPGLQSNLGDALRMRFDRGGGIGDLDYAIDVFESALAAISTDHPDRFAVLSNFGGALLSRSPLADSDDDVDRAIDSLTEVVANTPKGRGDWPRHLANLGSALGMRYDRSGATDDIDLAIKCLEEAAAATPADHPDRGRRLSDLGVQLEHMGGLPELNRAVQLFEQAAAATPEDDPDRAEYLSNLGTTLWYRFGRTHSAEDLVRALEAFRQVTTVMTAHLDVRARAARQWGKLAVASHNWPEAVQAFDAAIALMGLAVPRALEQADQEFRLSEFAGLASDAAAACLQAGQPARAVELFEQGRAVMFSQLLDARSDLTELRQAHPNLADEFVRYRDILDAPEARQGDLSSIAVSSEAAYRRGADVRRFAAAEFEKVLANIRSKPGFDRFLAPRELTELLPAAAQGPVVLLNVASLRCDALILTTEGVTVLPLEGVGPNQVAENTLAFLNALDEINSPALTQESSSAAAQAMAKVLGWLGERITGPVLDRLGYTNPPPDDVAWPRVWWCPAGALALLPLHAAGWHTSADAVIDRVVSSTIPTLRALLHARNTPRGELSPRILVVAMPHTPGQWDLPGTEREAATLQELWPDKVTVLGLTGTEPAAHGTVTASLMNHAWVHFACHGESDITDASASYLLLADQPLTIHELTQLQLPHADLAFLSACTTGRTGAKLPDEPIHLAAACQLAGYRHVIASLWPIADTATASLTEHFYTALRSTGSTTETATALHHAVRQLRAKYLTDPSLWAPYTHTGA